MFHKCRNAVCAKEECHARQQEAVHTNCWVYRASTLIKSGHQASKAGPGLCQRAHTFMYRANM